MKREDLRVMDAMEDGACNRCGSPAHGPATDADLAALGYVKLDRDRIAHALMVESWQHEGADLYPSPEGWYPFADRVLAALDGETT